MADLKTFGGDFHRAEGSVFCDASLGGGLDFFRPGVRREGTHEPRGGLNCRTPSQSQNKGCEVECGAATEVRGPLVVCFGGFGVVGVICECCDYGFGICSAIVRSGMPSPRCVTKRTAAIKNPSIHATRVDAMASASVRGPSVIGTGSKGIGRTSESMPAKSWSAWSVLAASKINAILRLAIFARAPLKTLGP